MTRRAMPATPVLELPRPRPAKAVATDENERLLLRPREVADRIGVSRSTAYELLASGEIPSIRIRGNLRVTVDQLHAWIAAQVAKQQR